ncbi:MAG: hypothetical protein ABH845_03675 [Candidatus Omnitrophota bacterium]
MRRRTRLLGTMLAGLFLLGCSRQVEEATQKVIDEGTGKTQVETYQRLQRQVREMNRDREKQFDEANQ